MKKELKQVKGLGGKAAAFVRAMVIAVDEAPAQVAKLRKVQEQGVESVEDLGGEISVPYISKLSAMLYASGVVEKTRSGRSFLVAPGPNFNEFTSFLYSGDYGTSLDTSLNMDEITKRSQFLDHMNEHGAVRIAHDQPLTKAAYSLAREKFNEGEYEMAFVKHDWWLEVTEPKNRAKDFVTYISSVSDQ